MYQLSQLEQLDNPVTVFAAGTFDLLHSGHVNFFRHCKLRAGEGSSLVVAVNTDDFVEQYKGIRPVLDVRERLFMVGELRIVDFAMMNVGGPRILETVKEAETYLGAPIHYIAHGDDWTGDSFLEQLGTTEDELARLNIQLMYVPYTHGISSSKIRARL